MGVYIHVPVEYPESWRCRTGIPSALIGEGLPGGLLEGSCGRRKRKRYAKPAKRRHECPLITAVSKHGILVIRWRRRVEVWPSGQTGADGLAFREARKAKGLREPGRNIEHAPPTYHAAYKDEYQPLNRPNSQLTHLQDNYKISSPAYILTMVSPEALHESIN